MAAWHCRRCCEQARPRFLFPVSFHLLSCPFVPPANVDYGPTMDTSKDRADLVRKFNELYYRGPDGVPLYRRVSFLGVETVKCPMDLWVYQEILHRTRPEVIIECGVHRG